MTNGERMGLKRELGDIFREYIEAIEKNSKYSRREICQKISEQMEVKAGTIYRYIGAEIAKKQVENLVNACIRFEVEDHSNRTALSKFVTEYMQKAKKLLGRQPEIHLEELSYTVGYKQVMTKRDEEKWNSVVCPGKLKECLDCFCKQSDSLMIIEGTKKSGITLSVTKYFIDKQKAENKESVIIPYVYDIEGKDCYQIEGWNELQDDLKKEYIILRVGYDEFKYYDFFEKAKAKIVILAHRKVKNKNVKKANRCVFNDLVNDRQCTEELFKMYVPQLYEVLEDQEEKETLEFVIDKLYDITGGIPMAIKRTGELVWRLYHVNGIGIGEIFEEDLCLIKEGQEVYEVLWEELLKDIWNRIDLTQQNIVKKVACVGIGVSKRMMWAITETNPDNTVLESMLDLFWMMESEKSGSNNLHCPDVRLFPLMRNLILYKMKKENEEDLYMQTMNKAVDYLKKSMEDSKMKGIYEGKRCFMDRSGEIQVVKSVLDFCYKYLKTEEYMLITDKLQPYFELREKQDEITDMIYRQRLKMAKKQKKNADILVSYAYIMDAYIRKGEKESAIQKLYEAKDYKTGSNSDTALYFIAEAKYYIYIKPDYKKAEEILNGIVTDKLSMEKKDELQYYLFVCKYQLQTTEHRKFLREIEMQWLKGEVSGNIILTIQYRLFIANIYIQQCQIKGAQEEILDKLKMILKDIQKRFECCRYPVVFQKYKYYLQKAYVAAFCGEEWRVYLDKAQQCYKRADLKNWRRDKKNALESIKRGYSVNNGIQFGEQ